MNTNNVRTSVVIEVANQGEPDDQKMYKIDFDDVESTKGFVIDQVYCGEDVTIYALFEASEFKSRELENQFLEVNRSGMSENLKLCNRNSCQKAINENSWRKRCDEDVSLPLFKEQSLYCLEHLEGGYKNPREKNLDMKVLYTKDSNTPKSTRFKSVSRGVNTDIAQSPRLLEEVQRAVSLNLSQSKKEKNFIVAASLSTSKLREVETHQSISSFGSEVTCNKSIEKSSPNILLVPLILMEDGMLSQLNKDKTEKLERQKISQGVNTDSNCFTELNEERELNPKDVLEKIIIPENQSIHCCDKELELKTENNLKSHFLNKELILEEIKNLQLKLNSLIQCLEHSNAKIDSADDTNIFNFSMNSNQDLRPPETLINNEICKETSSILDLYSQDQKSYIEYNRKNVEAMSFTNLVDSVTIKVSSTIYEVCESNLSQLDFKNENEDFIDWNVALNKKAPGTSKSEFKCLDQKFTSGVKRSLSLNLKEVKPDSIGLKKIKNAFYKLEGNMMFKESTRLHLTEETLLNDKFPLIKCEMGDELQEKIQYPKINLNFKPIFNDPDVLKGVRTNIAKKKEEGDAKHVKTNSRVHYCSTNIIPSNKILNEGKRLLKEKIVPVEKTIEKGMKTVDSGKSKTINFKDACSKKDVRVTLKANSRNKILQNQTNSQSEISVDTKQKPGSKKQASKNSLESKRLIDKEQKKTVLCSKTKIMQQSKLFHKEGATLLSRLPSQKRGKQDPTANCPNAKEKLVNSRKGNLGPVMVFERKLDSENTILPNRDIEMGSSEPSSVIVELFSKKPAFVDEIDSEMNQQFTGNRPARKPDDNESDKTIAKSVWALTKVLLYEDGSKKFEVLEASLTPPDYNLLNGKK